MTTDTAVRVTRMITNERGWQTFPLWQLLDMDIN